MKFIIIPKEVYDSVSEEKKRELGTGSPRASVDGSLLGYFTRRTL